MDIGNILENARTLVFNWGGLLIMLLGAVLVLWGVITLVKGLMTHGGGRPVNWAMVVVMILVGGFLMVQGFSAANMFADVGVGTLEQLSQPTH